MTSELREGFTVRGRLSRRLDTMLGLGALAVALLAWFVVTHGADPSKRMVSGIFLPSPGEIIEGTQDLFKSHELPGAIWISVRRIAEAMGITILIGVPVGILMGSIPVVDALLRKFVDGGKSVPPTAFFGVIILWFGIEEQAKVMFLFLGAVFYMALMTKNAIRNVRDEYIFVATDMGASTWQVIWRVLLPGALPQMWDAIIVCNGLMWTYIILAEWVNTQSGLGHMISIASRLNRSDEVFAGVILIALISATTDWALRSIRNRYLNW